MTKAHRFYVIDVPATLVPGKEYAVFDGEEQHVAWVDEDGAQLAYFGSHTLAVEFCRTANSASCARCGIDTAVPGSCLVCGT